MVTQDGVGNNPLEIQLPPCPQAGKTYVSSNHAAVAVKGNRSGGGGTIVNPPLVGYLEIFHTRQLPSVMGNVATDIAKVSTPAKQWTLGTTFQTFLMYGNRDLWYINGDYKHFTILVVVPGMYIIMVAYGNKIGSVGFGKFSPVENKLLSLFGEGVGVMVLAQSIFLPKTLWDIIRVKNPTDSKIEAVFQSGTHDVGSSTMTAQNLSGKKDIMSIATILAYMVYNGFNQDINAALVYEKIWYIQNYSPMRDHALVFLHSCMVVILRNTDTKPFSLHNQFQDKFPPQSRMWAQWRFEQLLSTLEIVVNIGIIP